MKWYDYVQLKDSIRNLNTENAHGFDTENLYDNIKKVKRKAAYIYKKLNDSNCAIKRNLFKHNVVLTEAELTDGYIRLYSTTNITKYRDFQYRLLTGCHLCEQCTILLEKSPIPKM